MIGIDWDKLANFNIYLVELGNSVRIGEHVGKNLVHEIFMKQQVMLANDC